MQKENRVNLPNFLSAYRLLSFPFLLWMVLTGKEELFALFFCINLVTDVLDGLIARVFNLRTEFGAKLDSLADVGTFILAFVAIILLKKEEMAHDMWLIWTFLAYYSLIHLFSFLKFKTNPTLHLYSMKVSGYIQGTFFFVLFAFTYYPLFFYVAMFFGFLAWTEELLILARLKKMKTDVKGILWMRRSTSN